MSSYLAFLDIKHYSHIPLIAVIGLLATPANLPFRIGLLRQYDP
jgi:hypothetical protein